MMRNFLVAFLLFLTVGTQAQELNCQVQVISPTVQGSNKQVFDEMRQSIFDFMNNTKFTNDKFKLEERIECSILINVSEQISADDFKGSIQVTSSRPVFNSAYKTTLLNVKDNDFRARYLRNTAIEFTPDVHRSNLASILAFYAYMIIGADYDGMALEGGSQYYNKAQLIVNNAANANEPGWKAFEGNANRYWLVDNALHRQFKPLRACYHMYHREGFDKMYDDINTGRQNVLRALELIRKVHQARPGSYNVQLWFSAKSDEIVKLFSDAQPQEKSKVFNLLKVVDAANISKYQKILSRGR